LGKSVGHIEVLQPGIGCSIQDQGRFGYLSEGVPISGAMDQSLSGLANLLVGNTEKEAVIEWKLIAPKLKFLSDCSFSVVGVDIQVLVNNRSVKAFKQEEAKKGDILQIKRNQINGYGYIAIKGGIQSKEVLGSRSFYANITSHNFLEKGMKLPIQNKISDTVESVYSKIGLPNFNEDVRELKVYKGPEFNLLSQKGQKQLIKKLFSINNQSNRMGFLPNETIESHSQSILSSPVLPGTVQWTPSGKLIILMRDAQTVGGYPRILQFREDAISELARVGNHDFVRFNLI